MKPNHCLKSTRRATLCLSLSVLMLASLAGCDRRGSTASEGNRGTTNNAATTPASGASR